MFDLHSKKDVVTNLQQYFMGYESAGTEELYINTASERDVFIPNLPSRYDSLLEVRSYDEQIIEGKLVYEDSGDYVVLCFNRAICDVDIFVLSKSQYFIDCSGFILLCNNFDEYRYTKEVRKIWII